ncbi:MAG TPA: hemerythrin domain-containing protein [Solimonas sp.]|nr:hemerythrin domain-containing protein [Solimonas sp.]
MNMFLTWISDWFGPRKAEAEASHLHGDQLARLRREHSISYSPQLIGRLCADHQQLLGMYQSVLDMLTHKRYSQIAPALGAFKSKFDAHILNENLRFYCYVEQKLQGPDLGTMKEFRSDMNGIARAVVNFVRKYQSAGVSAGNCRGFEEELRQIGAALVQRIQAEEQDLYTLYAP